jgi:outer membrane protein OmpA-like peptidoglycan-associated protein/opacity protein-like surface antigen
MTKRFDHGASWRVATIAMAAALILTGSAAAQTSAPASSKNAVPEGGYSLLDLTVFGGYQWFQFGQGTDAAVHKYNGSGVWGERLSEEIWRYIAIEEGVQIGYNRFDFQPSGSSTFSSASAGQTELYAAGVVHLKPRDAKFRPFVLVGPEYVWYRAPDIAHASIGAGPGVNVAALGPVSEQGRTALTYGIGLKINQSPRWAVRFDLRGIRSGSPHYGLPATPSGVGSVYLPSGYLHESALTASVGVTFRFRYRAPIVPEAPHVAPPPPPEPKANVQVGAITGAHGVCAGDDIRLTVTASGWLPNQTPAYQWTINGAPAPGGTGASFSVPTAGSPGAKTIAVRVSAGDSSATSAPVTVNVQPLTPPTIQFGISPSTVPYGTRITLAATGNGSTCGGPVTIRYTGQGVTGNTFDSTALTFDMSNRLKQQAQTVTITATATDQKNQTARATAPVTVTLTAQVRRLDDIVFPQSSSRVNNCAKRLLLEELTPMLRADPDSKVILIGHRDTTERSRADAHIDQARVINAAAVLSAGKGICPSLDLSRVLVNWVGADQNDETRPALCGTSTSVKEKGGQGVKESDKRAQYRRVEIWFVPGGADMPANLTGLQPAPVKDIQAKGCPK